MRELGDEHRRGRGKDIGRVLESKRMFGHNQIHFLDHNQAWYLVGGDVGREDNEAVCECTYAEGWRIDSLYIGAIWPPTFSS